MEARRWQRSPKSRGRGTETGTRSTWRADMQTAARLRGKRVTMVLYFPEARSPWPMSQCAAPRFRAAVVSCGLREQACN